MRYKDHEMWLWKRKNDHSVGLLKLKTEGWEQHAEILSKAVGTGTSFYEVPIRYLGRTYDEGKKIRAHHAVLVIWTIIRMRLFC